MLYEVITAPDRNSLARVATARAWERYQVPASGCLVVGDTEHDILCARAAGARVVAVASGFRDRETLAAHEPDLLLDDLRDPGPLLAWARLLSASSYVITSYSIHYTKLYDSRPRASRHGSVSRARILL